MKVMKKTKKKFFKTNVSMKYSITFLYLQNINERNDILNLTDICLTGCTRKRGASERRR